MSIATPPPAEDVDRGIYVNNYTSIMLLSQELSEGDHTLNSVPAAVREIIEERCWQKWLNPHTMQWGGWPPHQFREFIEAPRPHGLETSLATIRRFLGDQTPERLLFEESIRGTPGGNNNPNGFGGKAHKPTVKCDNVTLDKPDAPPPTIAIVGKAKKPLTGNSTGYAARRLRNSRPDLLVKVESGELTVNKAMIEAGYRERVIQITLDPEAATRIIVKHFKGEALDDLIRRLANWAGVPLAE